MQEKFFKKITAASLFLAFGASFLLPASALAAAPSSPLDVLRGLPMAGVVASGISSLASVALSAGKDAAHFLDGLASFFFPDTVATFTSVQVIPHHFAASSAAAVGLAGSGAVAPPAAAPAASHFFSVQGSPAVTGRVASAPSVPAGVSESRMNAQLSDLESRLVTRFAAGSGSAPATVYLSSPAAPAAASAVADLGAKVDEHFGQISDQIGLLSNINALDSVAITNGTISGNTSISVTGAISTTASLSASTLSVSDASTTRANLGITYANNANAIYPTYNIAAWGDSLTAGNEDGTGVTYPNVLSANLGNRMVYNGGVGGQTSIQIAARMLADTAKSSWTTVIWAGRNNYSSPSQVESDIAAMVASLGSNTHYLVLSVLNGSGSESIGDANYNQIISINTYLASTYSGHYLDIRSYLASQTALTDAGITPSAQDLTDIGNGVPPTDLRVDGIHLNAAGYALVATKVGNYITANLDSAVPLGVLVPSNLPSIFGSAFPIHIIGSDTASTTSAFSVSDSSANSRFVVTNGGNVGIGTTTPVSKLDIVSTALGGAYISIGNTNPNNSTDTLGLIFRHSIGFANSKIGVGGGIVSGRDGSYGGATISQNSNLQFLVAYHASDVERMRITGNGNVVIGTSTPYSKFTVWGLSALNVGNIFEVVTAGSSTAMTVNASGFTGLGVQNPLYQLDMSGTLHFSGGNTQPTLFRNGTTGGLVIDSNGAIAANSLLSIRTGGNASDLLTLLGTGKLGLGSTTPAARMSIANAFGGTIPALWVSTSTQGATSTAFMIDSGGRSAFGTSTAAQTLTVQGGVCVTSGTSCPTEISGKVVANGLIVQSAFDLAEAYPTSDPTLAAGEIVMIDRGNATHVARASESDMVIGIISTNPGFTLGTVDDSNKPVALAGRVPVKVSLEGGPIAIGDRIALSSVPGVGKKAADGDSTVGTALEAYSGGADPITVFVQNRQYVALSAQAAAAGGISMSDVYAGLSSMGATITNGLATFKSIVADKLTASVASVDSFTAADATIGTLRIESGFQIKDRDTGDVYCVTSRSGALVEEKGACPSVGGASSTTTAPVAPAAPISISITPNGDNPATITVGSSYLDLGATLHDDAYPNVGIVTTGDSFDTSIAGTHTIFYTVTDPAGNSATSMRTVTVVDVIPSAPAATSTSAN